YKKCNYPTTLAALDIKADEIDAVVDAAPALREWTCVPTPMTKEAFKKAILDTDEFGKSL
ncbi:MAG: glycerol dehydrogenase, partial [Megasphaera sp.]